MTLALDHRLVAVKVYPNRAELTVEARTHLEAGQHTLHFEGLSPHLEPQSFRLKAFGPGVVQSVQHRKVYRDRDHPYQQVPGQLRQQIEELDAQYAALGDESEILKAERSAIMGNQTLPANEKGGHVAEIKSLAEYLRVRLSDIAQRLRQAGLQRKRLEGDLQRLRSELEQISKPVSVVLEAAVLRFEALEGGEFRFLLQYLCSGAGWVPRYDIRVETTDAPAEIHFLAVVSNRTEVDWQDLPLVLSTAQPTQSGALPQLPVWHLRMAPEVRALAFGGMASGAAPPAAPKQKTAAMPVPDEERKELLLEESATAAEFTERAQHTLAQEYLVDVRFDVPSGGKPVNIPVQVYSPTTRYTHLAVPKRIPSAFLQALLTDWGSLNLLPGPANVFLEGDYVGETQILPDPEQAELSIGLGQDAQVLIKYSAKHDHTAKSFFGGIRKRSFGYEIVVRNQKPVPIRLELLDHIPVSQHQDIKVELTDGHGAALAEDTGRLTWQLELAPGQARTLAFRYEVRFPKDLAVDWGEFLPGH